MLIIVSLVCLYFAFRMISQDPDPNPFARRPRSRKPVDDPGDADKK